MKDLTFFSVRADGSVSMVLVRLGGARFSFFMEFVAPVHLSPSIQKFTKSMKQEKESSKPL
jgi:hypothetical protein